MTLILPKQDATRRRQAALGHFISLSGNEKQILYTKNRSFGSSERAAKYTSFFVYNDCEIEYEYNLRPFLSQSRPLNCHFLLLATSGKRNVRGVNTGS